MLEFLVGVFCVCSLHFLPGGLMEFLVMNFQLSLLPASDEAKNSCG